MNAMSNTSCRSEKVPAGHYVVRLFGKVAVRFHVHPSGPFYYAVRDEDATRFTNEESARYAVRAYGLRERFTIEPVPSDAERFEHLT